MAVGVVQSLPKDENCLLCHLRDDYWLSKKLKQEKQLKIPYKKILYFVKKSGYFYHERRNYEQRVVRWQINFILDPHSEGWICDEQYGGDLMFMSPNCDIGFRKAVKDTLLAVGMDEEAIEEGLEKNTNLWLDKMIEQAFFNEYDNFSWNSNFLGSNYGIEIPRASNEHKIEWIQLRKSEYYYKHCNSIIKYGNKDWLQYRLSPKEQLKLELKVKELNFSRLTEIDFYKQQRETAKLKINQFK